MKELVHRLRAAFLVQQAATNGLLCVEQTQGDRAPMPGGRRVPDVRTFGELRSYLAAAIDDLDRPDASTLAAQADLEHDGARHPSAILAQQMR